MKEERGIEEEERCGGLENCIKGRERGVERMTVGKKLRNFCMMVRWHLYNRSSIRLTAIIMSN